LKKRANAAAKKAQTQTQSDESAAVETLAAFSCDALRKENVVHIPTSNMGTVTSLLTVTEADVKMDVAARIIAKLKTTVGCGEFDDSEIDDSD